MLIRLHFSFKPVHSLPSTLPLFSCQISTSEQSTNTHFCHNYKHASYFFASQKHGYFYVIFLCRLFVGFLCISYKWRTEHTFVQLWSWWNITALIPNYTKWYLTDKKHYCLYVLYQMCASATQQWETQKRKHLWKATVYTPLTNTTPLKGSAEKILKTRT